MSEKKTSIGGQAVIEGVMMRGKKIYAMAVRNPEGGITIEKEEWGGGSAEHQALVLGQRDGRSLADGQPNGDRLWTYRQ